MKCLSCSTPIRTDGRMFCAKCWNLPINREARQPASAPAPLQPVEPPPPPNWQAWMDENHPNWRYATGNAGGTQPWNKHTAATRNFIRNEIAAEKGATP